MRKLLIFLVLGAVLHSCVIPSIHPLYTEEDLIIDPGLFGVWDDDGNKWDFMLAFDRHDKHDSHHTDKTISLVCTSNDSENPVEFDIHMVKLGKYYYLDFIARNYTIENDLLDFHLMPFHNFARVEVGKEQVTIEFFDPDWFEGLLENNRIRIDHEFMETHDLYVLTASTRSLQKFITKYGDDPEAYSEPIVLEKS